jgi:hypothetical protein
MNLLTAVDCLYLYDPQFEGSARRFLSDVGGSSGMQSIRSWDELLSVGRNYTNVKFLVFDTHGSPGVVFLSDKRVEGIDLMFLAEKPRFLAKDAQVLFLGCNLGEGIAGDRFLDEVGKCLLRGKGGIVGAATVATVVFQFSRIGLSDTETYLDPLKRGRLKVRRYDASGVPVGSIVVDRNGRSQGQ